MAAFRPRTPSSPRAIWLQSSAGPRCVRAESSRIRTTSTAVRPPPLGNRSIRQNILRWSFLSIAIGGTSLLYVVLSADGSLQLSAGPKPVSNPVDVTPIIKSTRRKSAKSHFRSLWNSIKRNIIEPLATASRFLYLLALFLPVLVTSPVVLLEYIELAHPRKRRKRRKDGTLITERASTIWWYKLLVSSTQKAGPTFIKVCSFIILIPSEIQMKTRQANFNMLHPFFLFVHSWPNGRPPGLIYFQQHSVNISGDFTPMANLIQWLTRAEC